MPAAHVCLAGPASSALVKRTAWPPSVLAAGTDELSCAALQWPAVLRGTRRRKREASTSTSRWSPMTATRSTSSANIPRRCGSSCTPSATGRASPQTLSASCLTATSFGLPRHRSRSVVPRRRGCCPLLPVCTPCPHCAAASEASRCALLTGPLHTRRLRPGCFPGLAARYGGR